MKIVNLKKFIRSILVILIFIFIFSLIISKSTLSHKETIYKTICIQNGDTLWNISKELQENNDYYNNKDIRYIINDLMKINNLDSNILYENQQIEFPIA